MKLGEIPISKINININSRDDIPTILLGLQHIYITTDLRNKVFTILENEILPDTDYHNGRPGMDLWNILVLGVLRVNLNWDYDRLEEMANNHKTIREMLGNNFFNDEYKLQTLKDNVSLLTPEIVEKINHIVVQAGHDIVKNEDEEELRCRCDSFVVETNVHYPTDINLLFDAMRKIITLIATLCSICGLTGWRQSKHIIKTVKRIFRKAQKLKRSTSKNSEKKEQREKIIIEAHQQYIDIAIDLIEKSKSTLGQTTGGGMMAISLMLEIEKYISHAERQIDQIRRRVVEGKKIPHSEKVFSIFEEHTEWISKGKAGVPVELGLKVCIVEDQHGFILNHLVMEKATDDQVAVPIIKQTKNTFTTMTSCSFDKGFHSPDNQQDLLEYLNFVVLPKKGRLSKKDKDKEYSEEFIKARKQHSAVESAINALEIHGLDKCLDHGITRFKKYISLAVLGRNIQQLGVKLRDIERNRQQGKLKLAA